jgi:hypothetical protein
MSIFTVKQSTFSSLREFDIIEGYVLLNHFPLTIRTGYINITVLRNSQDFEVSKYAATWGFHCPIFIYFQPKLCSDGKLPK